jgi:hypothetical protein
MRFYHLDRYLVMCNKLSQPQLAAYFDGTAPIWVTRHVLHCPSCRMQLSQWEQAHKQLSQQLTTPQCLSTMTLGEYHLDTLTLEESLAVWEHLQICAVCRTQLAAASAYIDEQATSKTILYPALMGDAARASIALRDSMAAAASDMTFKIPEAEINISVRPMTIMADQSTITGLVTGISVASGARVDLVPTASSEPIASATVDPLGGFVFTQVGHGAFTIVLHGVRTSYALRGITID